MGTQHRNPAIRWIVVSYGAYRALTLPLGSERVEQFCIEDPIRVDCQFSSPAQAGRVAMGDVFQAAGGGSVLASNSTTASGVFGRSTG